MKTKIKTSVVITGLVCLTLIQFAAMYFGIDGWLRATIAAIIAAAIGVAVPTPKFK